MLEITPDSDFTRKKKTLESDKETEYRQLKAAVIKLRKAENAFVTCKDLDFRRQIVREVVKEQQAIDKLVGLKFSK
jgi:hypothetical protein